MNTPEERAVVLTAFISAIVESVRAMGPLGMNEDRLYKAVSTMADRKAFDMVIAELIEQKTLKRVVLNLVYCGPCMVE